MVMVVLVFVGLNVFTRLVVVVVMVITYPQELHDNDNGNGFLLPEKEKRKLPVRTMEHYIGIVVATSITRCWKCPHCCCSQGIVHGAGATVRLSPFSELLPVQIANQLFSPQGFRTMK